MFPPDHIVTIINLTHVRLQVGWNRDTTKGEITKFFGVIILGTKFVFASRKDLLGIKSVSQLIDPLNFGARPGMPRNRFDDLWSCIRFSEQLDERHPSITNMVHRWMLVDDFIEAFNNYRASNYSLSDRICVDESISRWYRFGGALD